MPVNIYITCEQGPVSIVANAKTEEMGASQEVIEDTNSFSHIYVPVNTHREPQVRTEMHIGKDRVPHRGTNVNTNAQENEVRVKKTVLRTGSDLGFCH
jgi:hypothetical protein